MIKQNFDFPDFELQPLTAGSALNVTLIWDVDPQYIADFRKPLQQRLANTL